MSEGICQEGRGTEFRPLVALASLTPTSKEDASTARLVWAWAILTTPAELCSK